MTIQELFIRSNQELKKVVDQISEDQWNITLPTGMSRNPSTIRQAVNYHTYDDAWVPDVLAGKTKEQVGDAYDFLLSAKDTKTEYSKYNALAVEAVRSFDDLEKNVHLSYGDFPAHDYLQHVTSFRAFRCYDLAQLLGFETKLPNDFVQALWDEYSPVIEDYRTLGVFPPAVKVPEDADLQTKLLGLAGRR